MSLVNDMLDDLEQRNSAEAVQQHTLSTGVGASSHKGRQVLLLVVAFSALGVACFSAAAYWSNAASTESSGDYDIAESVLIPLESTNIESREKPQSQSPLAAKIENDLMTTAVAHEEAFHNKSVQGGDGLGNDAEKKPAIIDRNSNDAIGADEQQPTRQVEPPSRAEVVATLLAEAREYEALQQLTTPAAANAVDRYRQILVLAPANQSAIQGLRRVVESYRALAAGALTENRFSRAEVYVRRGLSVAEEFGRSHPPLENARSELDLMHQRIGRAEIAVESEPASEMKPGNANDNSASPIQTIRSENRFKTRLLRARQWVEVGRHQQALELLQQEPPPASLNPEYIALLAALLNQNQNYDRAADLYLELLANDARNFDYWLGLAVTLDAMQDRYGALEAFQSARQLGNADPDSMDYIERRIQHLSVQGKG